MTEQTPTGDRQGDPENDRRNALVDEVNSATNEPARPSRTHDESVLLRLTVMAWFVGIFTVIAFIGLIVGIALFSSELNDLVAATRNHP